MRLRPHGHVVARGKVPDNDDDVDNWLSCTTCGDVDGDGYFAGCDAYTIRQQDCEDSNLRIWAACATVFFDRWVGCDRYDTIEEDEIAEQESATR